MKPTRTFRTALVVAFSLFFLASAQATLVQYSVALSGPAESPPNASPATGLGLADYDTLAHTLSLQVIFTGLLGTTTASHIHAATATQFTGVAGVATTLPSFAGFPTGVTSSFYNNTLDLTLASSYNPAFIAANGGTTASAETALIAAINTGKAYLNIHTTAFPGGEIRGFLIPIPEPTTIVFGLGVAGVCLTGSLRAFRRKAS